MLAAGSARGESGVSVASLRFRGAVHFEATPRRHLIWFQTSPPTRFECRLADRMARHECWAGSIAICPAGMDTAAMAAEDVDAMLVEVDPSRLALAAAEESALGAQLIERFLGQDRILLELARSLAWECANGYPNGPLFWNQLARGFVDGLVARHMSAAPGRMRGRLGGTVLERIRDYILAHLDEPIEVEALARIAGRSPFHFSRVFARSVGMTPHRFVVHLRLQRAVELVRAGESGLGEIAARTGFADQSHLSRWVRRVHGVPLTQLIG